MNESLSPRDIDAVRRLNVFQSLSDPGFAELVAPATAADVRAHDVIFRQGDAASAFFVVIDGWVKLYRLTPAGDEAVIHIFTRGESFAEAAALLRAQYPATAAAVSDGRVVSIPSSHVVECIRRNPDIALAMIASMSQHLHRLVQDVEQLKAQTGSQRLADFLLSFCDAGAKTCSIALPYEKALLAGRLGLKPETLSRTFQKLRKLGVNVQSSHVTIKNVTVLRDFVGTAQR